MRLVVDAHAVIAHEVGHHVQNQIGVLSKVNELRSRVGQADSNRLSVLTELQADCFAGIWVAHATETKDANGNTLLQPITEQDIQSALSAAAAVGDDRIQQKAQGRVTPENWTHGSAVQRQKWFVQGYNTGA